MPNHCHNNLWLRGDAEAIQEFINKVKQEENGNVKYDICSTFLPTPEELVAEPAKFGPPENDEQAKRQRSLIARYGSKNWYDWNIKNWGTKWGDYDTYLDDVDTETKMFGFTSAWSPPDAAIRKIAAMFPSIVFIHYFSEEGMGFFGLDVYENGEHIIDEDRIYGDIPGFEELSNAEDYDGAWSKVQDAAIGLLESHGYGGLIEAEVALGPKGF